MHKRVREEEGEVSDGSSSGEDVDPATEYVSLTKELQRVAALYATEVTAPRRVCADDKAVLMTYMDAQGIEYAKVPAVSAAAAVPAPKKPSFVYVKVSTVTTGGRSLCVGTFVDVVKELRTTPAVLAAAEADVDEELEAGKAKWARDHADEEEEEDLPETPQARITSRGASQRAIPPLGRPLTTAEQLAEVLYAAVHRVHKPRKRKLEITKTTKRGAVAVPLAGDMAARAAACFAVETAVKARAKEYAAVRAKCRQAMAECEAALGAHMAETHEDIVAADGSASVVLSLETKPEKAKPLTLPEFSAMLDAIVATLPLREGAPMSDLLREFGDVIVDALIVAMEARLAARALETVVVVKKPGGGGGGRGKLAVDDAFEGSDDEEDDEDNMYGV
jgi:hypothetical protein